MNQFQQESLISFIYRVSRTVSTQPLRTVTLHQLAADVAGHFGAGRVLLRIDAVAGRALEAVFEAQALVPRGPCHVVFSNPLVEGGVSHGRFTVELTAPEGEPASVLAALESVARLITLLAERVRLREERALLEQELLNARQALARHKLLARAAGIVAERKRLGQDDAATWIENEAARMKRPVQAIAARIVEVAAERAQARVA